MPASPDTFLVTCNGIGAIGIDYVDADTEPDEDVIFAFVTFRPRLEPGTIIWAPGLTPPRGIHLDDVKARFSPEDGKLRTIVGRPTNEKQLVTVTGGGPFTLNYAGQPTSSITGTGTVAAVRAALEALPNVGVGNVFVSGATANEKQTVTVSGSPTSFTLNTSAGTTNPIVRMASASLVQAALQNKLGSGEASVSGPSGGPWVVEFTGSLAGTNVAQMTGTAIPSGSVNVATTVAGSTGTPYTVSFIGTLAATDVAQMTATGATVSTITAGTGDLGVKLVANTALLDLDELIYDVEFDVPESDRILQPFAIMAPTHDRADTGSLDGD